MVGVFDSGMGGLSVLRTLRQELPSESYLYYGDNANAPYGERSRQEILALTQGAVSHLLSRGIKALVLACNTATSVAAETLREQLTIPVIGMEPALKPAQTLRHGGRILVMATPATLSLPKFASLMGRYGEGAVPVPVRGLVERIERGDLQPEQMEGFLQEVLKPYLQAGPVDAVVLGCTHYLFVRELIARVVGPQVPLVDGNLGTAQQLRRRLMEEGLLRPDSDVGEVMLESSAQGEDVRALMERLLYR